eukprot:scaffold8537_cov57-Phaeocystis_antarctica.AAC.2
MASTSCRRSGSILFGQPAAAAGSRAAAEGQARGLDTGTSDPRRRPEGDQGQCTGCARRARARPSPSVTVDLVCRVGAGHPRCSRPARSRRVQLVPSLAAGGGARPGCSNEQPDHPAAGALSLAGAPAGQHLAGRCSGDGRLLREVFEWAVGRGVGRLRESSGGWCVRCSSGRDNLENGGRARRPWLRPLTTDGQ